MVTGHGSLDRRHRSVTQGCRIVAAGRIADLLLDPRHRVGRVGEGRGCRRGSGRGRLANATDNAGQTTERSADESTDRRGQQVEDDKSGDSPGGYTLIAAGRAARTAGQAAGGITADEGSNNAGHNEPRATGYGKGACIRVSVVRSFGSDWIAD